MNQKFRIVIWNVDSETKIVGEKERRSVGDQMRTQSEFSMSPEFSHDSAPDNANTQIQTHTKGGFMINISNNSFDACQINLVQVTFGRSPPKFFLQTESKSILKTTKLIQLTNLQNSIIALNSIFACQVFLRLCQLTKV